MFIGGFISIMTTFGQIEKVVRVNTYARIGRIQPKKTSGCGLAERGSPLCMSLRLKGIYK